MEERSWQTWHGRRLTKLEAGVNIQGPKENIRSEGPGQMKRSKQTKKVSTNMKIKLKTYPATKGVAEAEGIKG